jgi:hypothetical protein
MRFHSASRRSLWFAGTMVGLLVAGPLAAQPSPVSAPPAAQAPAPLPPGSPLIGRPDNNPAAAKLAPIAPPPIPTVADKLPTAQLKVPKGFNIEVYASGMFNARTLRVGDKGTVFVGSRLADKVYYITEKDGNREAKALLSGLYRPHGLAYHNGTLHRRAT